jgi:hypothetical protein
MIERKATSGISGRIPGSQENGAGIEAARAGIDRS